MNPIRLPTPSIGIDGREVGGEHELHTSLERAEAADPRSAGSIESKVSISAKAGRGNSLNVSATHRLYGCWGLKIVA